MANGTKRVLSGIGLGALPGVVLWVIGAIIGGEAMLSFGAIGILVAVVGMIIGGVVAGGARSTSGSDARTSAAGIGAVIGCVPGIALIFIMTRLAIPVMLVGGLIGAYIGRHTGSGGGRPTAVH